MLRCASLLLTFGLLGPLGCHHDVSSTDSGIVDSALGEAGGQHDAKTKSDGPSVDGPRSDGPRDAQMADKGGPQATCRVITRFSERLTGIYGFSDTDIWISGLNGLLASFDGKTWAQTYPYGYGEDLLALWGVASKRLFITFQSGKVVHQSIDATTTPSTVALLAVDGVSESHVWVAGFDQNLYLWDGKGWQPKARSKKNKVADLWVASTTAAWGVGSAGMIIRYDGSKWNDEASPTTDTLSGVWGGSPSDIWAVGDKGRIIHWTGTTWNTVLSPTSEVLIAVSGNARGDLWAVGEKGTVLFYRAGKWRAVASTSTQRMEDVWVSNAGKAWIVGAASAIPNEVLNCTIVP